MIDKLEKEYKYITTGLTAHCSEAEKLGHKVVLVALQGSQNYDLAYEGSDIDTKCLIIPSFDDIVCTRRPVSTTHVRENNEHIDIKDIRLYFEQFWKQNINFLEILFTPYIVCDGEFAFYWKKLIEMREDIVHFNRVGAVKTMFGMAVEKFRAMKHPYPTIKHKINKYGYDGKQLHHILRLEEFVRAYIAGEPFSKCLVSYPKYGRDFLISVKKNEVALDKADELADKSLRLIERMVYDFVESAPKDVDVVTKEKAEEVLCDTLKYYIIKEMEIKRND